MGYDVKIIRIAKNGDIYERKDLYEFSMTYNFSRYKQFWYLPEEFNGQSGKEVADRIKEVLNIINIEIALRTTLEEYLKLAEDHPNDFFINDYYSNNIQIILDREIDYDRPIEDVDLEPIILFVNFF